jgi:glucose/arabinose dehydrogenase
MGHRNPLGLAIDSVTGRIWSTEFGPRGGDELNLIEKGKNYGWILVTNGIHGYCLCCILLARQQ